MIYRIKNWLNSIHAHMLAMAFGVIAALTTMSYSIFFLSVPPERTPVSIYEMSRIVRGLPLKDETHARSAHNVQGEPRLPTGQAEQLISAGLADKLGVPSTDVRVHLNEGDRARAAVIAKEIDLYGKDGGADPEIVGTFEIAVKSTSGGWRVYSHEARNPVAVWDETGRESLLIGVLLVIPLSLWFSLKLNGSIRTFAVSVRQLGAGMEEHPVPITGPTEIRVAAASINEMQSRLARYVRERTSVVGAIAHDLRTPLTRLQFHLTSAPEPVRHAAEEEIRQMERLIGTTLDFVDNESRPRLMEPLDLTTLVEGLVDDCIDMGQDVSMEASEPITIAGDMVLLKRLFTNLIDNAVKYGRVARIAVRREGNSAIVEVKDNGPGMTADQAARAFEPFYRGEPSRNSKTGGVGLGLSIVQSATEAHGGSATLVNRPEGGLCARVVLAILAPDAL